MSSLALKFSKAPAPTNKPATASAPPKAAVPLLAQSAKPTATATPPMKVTFSSMPAPTAKGKPAAAAVAKPVATSEPAPTKAQQPDLAQLMSPQREDVSPPVAASKKAKVTITAKGFIDDEADDDDDNDENDGDEHDDEDDEDSDENGNVADLVNDASDDDEEDDDDDDDDDDDSDASINTDSDDDEAHSSEDEIERLASSDDDESVTSTNSDAMAVEKAGVDANQFDTPIPGKHIAATRVMAAEPSAALRTSATRISKKPRLDGSAPIGADVIDVDAPVAAPVAVVAKPVAAAKSPAIAAKPASVSAPAVASAIAPGEVKLATKPAPAPKPTPTPKPEPTVAAIEPKKTATPPVAAPVPAQAGAAPIIKKFPANATSWARGEYGALVKHFEDGEITPFTTNAMAVLLTGASHYELNADVQNPMVPSDLMGRYANVLLLFSMLYEVDTVSSIWTRIHANMTHIAPFGESETQFVLRLFFDTLKQTPVVTAATLPKRLATMLGGSLDDVSLVVCRLLKGVAALHASALEFGSGNEAGILHYILDRYAQPYPAGTTREPRSFIYAPLLEGTGILSQSEAAAARTAARMTAIYTMPFFYPAIKLRIDAPVSAFEAPAPAAAAEPAVEDDAIDCDGF